MKKPILLLLMFAILSCSETEDSEPQNESDIETIEIPSSSIDYNSLDNWTFHPNKTTILTNYNLDIEVIDENLEVEQTIAISNNSSINTGVDVFFVHPTLLSTQQSLSEPENIAIEEQNEVTITLTTLAQAGILSKYGRMFAPRYRQSSAVTYGLNTDKTIQANIVATSYSDIKAAFMDYLENFNNGNKIIFAGHSQGSYLLAMLLRDVFDNNETLRNQIVTVALGGLFYVYAEEGTYNGGWWENIPLCTTVNECGCILNWTSYDESQAIPETFFGYPEFNPLLVNSGLIYREFNQNQDWFIQDNTYYGEQSTPLQNYIAPNANYNFGTGANFIAFNNLYNINFRRDGLQKVALSVSYNSIPNDQRPNDLASEQNNSFYSELGYHNKDYQIYLWALMEQIDIKLSNCQ